MSNARIPLMEIRLGLRLTQEKLSLLLGVPVAVIAQVERGRMWADPFAEAMIRAAGQALQRVPDVGTAVAAELRANGPAQALFVLLSAAFGGSAS